MDALPVERRMSSQLNGALAPSNADIIRKSLLMRREIGTMSAFEYLRSHAVNGTVIRRILSDGVVRAEDRQAMLDTAAH